MNKKNIMCVFLAAGIGLASLSLIGLGKNPVSFFALRAAQEGVEAYKLSIRTSPLASSAEAIRLSPAQTREGAEILDRKNIQKLREFSGQFGKWPAVIGIPSGMSWPIYLGGGWKAVFSGPAAGQLDDLSFLDKLYLALRTTAPPAMTPASGENIAEMAGPIATETAAPKPEGTVPVQEAAAVTLRLEILNGCGIKKAADWLAFRLKGPRIGITGTGNAEHYHYPETVVRVSGGVSPVLAEILDRMGIPAEKAVLDESLGRLIDARIIVGKDFRKIKERMLGRKPH